MTKIKPER